MSTVCGVWMGWGGVSPTALFAGHGPLWIVLAVAEVGREVVKPDDGTTAKHGVVTCDLQL